MFPIATLTDKREWLTLVKGERACHLYIGDRDEEVEHAYHLVERWRANSNEVCYLFQDKDITDVYITFGFGVYVDEYQWEVFLTFEEAVAHPITVVGGVNEAK